MLLDTRYKRSEAVNMKVSVIACYKHVRPGELEDKTVVVIDALRASATIITAIDNGCIKLMPAQDTEAAMKLYRSTEGKYLLCGEREGYKISGYHLGNSPLEYKEEIVKDNALIFTTTNGSKCIVSATFAKQIVIGTFINAMAIAKYLVDGQAQEVCLLGAGEEGAFAMEDVLAAGAILSRIMSLTKEVELDDLGVLAHYYYTQFEGNLDKALEGTKHYSYLKSIGFEQDIDYCLSMDIVDTIPVYQEGEIVALKQPKSA